MEQEEQQIVQINVQQELTVQPEVQHVHHVQPERIPLMKVQVHVPLVEPENGVQKEVQPVII